MQREHGEAVRDGDGQQQRQQHVDVVRQLEREDDAGERRAHGAAEDRAHAHQRPEARAFVRQEHGLDAAQRAAHHQQRRQHAARSSRAERHRPDHRFHQQDAENHVARHVALQQRADGVVADAQRLREDQAAEADDQAAERRPPHPVDGQLLKEVLGGVDGSR